MEIIDINSKKKHEDLAFLKTKNNFAIEFLSEALKEETDIIRNRSTGGYFKGYGLVFENVRLVNNV